MARQQGSNYLIGFPLLLIPFAIYNIIAFLFQTGFTDVLFSVQLLSRATFAVTMHDVLITLSILLLFVEIMKSTRVGIRSVVDHILSLLLFIVMIGEFMAVPQAATSTFFTLVMLCFVDVISGYTVGIRSAQRDITVEREGAIT
jgi:hypothetical protein